MKAPRLLLVLVAACWMAGCAAGTRKGLPPTFVGVTVPAPLQARVDRLSAEGERNWVLNLQELSLEALAIGDRDTAKRALDEALLQIEIIYGDSDQARRARSAFYKEESKIFKGDPYERTMTYFYRGVLYMQDREWDNARACFRSAAFMDAIAEDEQSRCDWALMDYLIGVCDLQLGETANAFDEFGRAAQNYASFRDRYMSMSGPVGPQGRSGFDFLNALPAFEEDANLLVLIQHGNAPRKVGVGRYGEFIGISPGGGADSPVTVRVGSRQPKTALVGDSVFFQAATRGGREVDAMHGREAFFKEATQETGTAVAQLGVLATVFGLGSSLDSGGGHHGGHHHDFHADGDGLAIAVVGLAVAAVGLAVYGISELVHPEADLRQWTTLPDTLAFYRTRVDQPTTLLEVRYSGASALAQIAPPPKSLCVVLALEKPAPVLVIAPHDLANPPQPSLN